MRWIVSDTGPILHLHEGGALSLLALAGTIFIPPAVDLELAPRLPERPDWLRVQALSPLHVAEVVLWRDSGLLHAGEAEAVALCRQIGAEWLLTDAAGRTRIGV